jgi:hypothetical protein
MKYSDGIFSQQLIGYDTTSSYDNGYDGLLLNDWRGVYFILFINEDSYKIQGLAFNIDNDQVRLGYFSAVGSFNINIDSREGCFGIQNKYLYRR